MASSSSVLSEDQPQCSICQDLFTDPVAAPFKSVQGTFSSTPEKARRFLVLCDICCEKKHEALKSCLICMTSHCKTHLEPHQTDFSFKTHNLIDPVENLKDYICKKHERPLEMFCRDDQTCVCHFCTETEYKNHKTVPIEEESGMKKTELVKKQAENEQMIQDCLMKIDDIKHSVKVNQENTEKEKADSMEIFRALICSIEGNQAELLKVMEEKQRAAERQAEEFIKDLEQEITELKRRNTELEQISNTEDHLHLLQIYPYLCRPPPTNNWTDVSIQSHLDVETLRRARAQLQECVDEVMKKVVSMELKRIQQYAVDVILDPDTANPYLILSDDGKQVSDGDTKQDLPDNKERFDTCVCVLGKEGFSSGRFYYEVQVKGKTEWELGVTRESSNRKGIISAGPENGEWSVCLRNETEYKALDFTSVLLSLKQAPQKVGVFVDYEQGLVSFYDVENESHIYSYTGQSFTQKIYPIFSPCVNDDGENSAPLIICPVSLGGMATQVILSS